LTQQFVTQQFVTQQFVTQQFVTQQFVTQQMGDAEMTDTPAAKPEIQTMQVGGSGQASVTFKDSFGDPVEVTTVDWQATGPLAISVDEKDPTKATFFASDSGLCTLWATGTTDTGGRLRVRQAVQVMQKGVPVEGEIAVTLEPAKEKAKAEA
jgi:hypothetical protein